MGLAKLHGQSVVYNNTLC